MGAAGAFSWNSELPSGYSPFWIRDHALAGLGLAPGDVVSVDTGAEPRPGDLVVAEVDATGDGDSQRVARRYDLVAEGRRVRLEPVGAPDARPIEVPADQVIVMGVVRGRVHILDGGARISEEPLDPEVA